MIDGAILAYGMGQATPPSKPGSVFVMRQGAYLRHVVLLRSGRVNFVKLAHE